jgi:hypothetical protein
VVGAAELERLKTDLQVIPWFANVGTFAGGGYARTESWEDAKRAGGSAEWESVELFFANALGDALVTKDPELYEQWNTVSEPLAEFLRVHVHESALSRYRAPIPKGVVDGVRWNLLHAGMEQFFVESVPPGFFTEVVGLYKSGLFPCGWVGEPPRGRLIVF